VAKPEKTIRSVPNSIGREVIAWAQPVPQKPLGLQDENKGKTKRKIEKKKHHSRFRMATAVLRRPLLASLLPAVGGGAAAGSSCSASSRPRCHLRRRRSPFPVLAVSSDSSKPLASTSTGGGADPDEEPVLPLLQELAVRRSLYILVSALI
jgi:hypothetical protein